jgi:hypothetical protein
MLVTGEVGEQLFYDDDMDHAMDEAYEDHAQALRRLNERRKLDGTPKDIDVSEHHPHTHDIHVLGGHC